MSQSNIDNLKKQSDKLYEANKYEFGSDSKPSDNTGSSGNEGNLTDKLQGAINDANKMNNNNGSSSGSGFASGSGLGMNFDYNDNNDNDYGNYDNDNDD